MSEKGQTLVEHLTELRKRILIMAAAIIVGVLISYGYIDKIAQWAVRPSKQLEFIYLSPPELFLSYIKMAVVCGVVIASPVIFFQIWLFVSPGINKKQRIYLTLAVLFATLFFLIGILFGYFAILPLTMDFFVKMSSDNIVPLFSFESYVGFISSILLAFGVAFELPLAVLILTKLNLLKISVLRKSRKYIILAIFVLSAILTPPDVISQVLLACPMIFLFELSIVVSSLMTKKQI